MPFGVDALVIVLSATHSDIFWIFPPIVTAASLVSAAVTYWVGHTAGSVGLPRLVPAHHLQRIKGRLDETGAGMIAVAAVLPPPFPLTPILLTCGALQFDRWRFFLVFGVMRLVRFSVAALLARHYADHLLQILEWDGLRRVLISVALLACMTAIASVAIRWRRTRPEPA